jgi:hypothetical protein
MRLIKKLICAAGLLALSAGIQAQNKELVVGLERHLPSVRL